MNIPLNFIRIFFLCLCTLLSTLYMAAKPDNLTPLNLLIGFGTGVSIGCAFIAVEKLLEGFDLYAFNTAALGLLIGYMMGQITITVIDGALHLSTLELSRNTEILLRIGVYLTSIFIGMSMTVRSADQLKISIPFIKLKESVEKKREIIVDSSILGDPRMIDLASSGLLDGRLVVPRFILKELYIMSESADEIGKTKAKRCLDVVKKLETIPSLNLKYADTDYPEVSDTMQKLVRLARMNNSTLLTADINRVQQASIEGVQIINIHSLANALKPINQSGETLLIKIQRYGKEPRQGVGYLEDGTMVVVNGGAEYIGETIDAQVLSVKHTSSGRMIFCNAPDEEFEPRRMVDTMSETHSYASI